MAGKKPHAVSTLLGLFNSSMLEPIRYIKQKAGCSGSYP